MVGTEPRPNTEFERGYLKGASDCKGICDKLDALERRANQLRGAVCQILSATGRYSHDIPRLAKEALQRDNELLDLAR